ncbi:hypothetical protein F6X51_17100 [Methylobacterium planeticum]|uniref:Uncharacterized protein n=2 Tax=Methylobacterium planeticum TaxID=2615211 RepID=A0A6N6MU17_9HYPH|nr:hypothetical protein F6X51_17100 [Methylobacterium planeticum]
MPIAEAAVFTAGCLVIHTQQRRADQVTVALACVAVLLAFVLGIALTPDSFLRDQVGVAIENGELGQQLD